MRQGAFILGYHGCDQEMAEAILAGNQQLKPSENEYDWLGHGIYFWENNPKRAIDWAQYLASTKRFKRTIKKPYAIGAIIDPGNCLDLTESLSLKLVKESYKWVDGAYRSLGFELPKNKAVSHTDKDLLNRSLDCLVINVLHDLRQHNDLPEFNNVRGAFHEGEPLYPGACIKAKTHIQLCVRENASIVGVFRVKGIDKL